MKKSILVTLVGTLLIIISSCGGNTDVVDSGMYNGTIKKVEAAKTEIYVTLDNGKTIELYFTEQTTLTKNGTEVEFAELAKGQNVKVEVKKVGKRLEPVSVLIVE